MSVTCKSLKIENDSLKDQIKALKGDFQNLEKILRGFETAADKGRHSCINEVEIQKHFEFYGKSYDDLNHFKDEANAELRKLKSRLNAIDEQVETIANSIEESRQYSYKYNLKITGIPQLNSRESAVETTQLCINLFNKLGVDVHQYDIDIAHRVSARGASAGPKPIICKFVRRVVKEQIMEVRKRITDFQAGDICSELNGSLENARILDHLTPNIQRLLAETKVYQRQQNYRFCWVKNFVVLLRENEHSDIIRVTSYKDLEKLRQAGNTLLSSTGSS